MCFFSYVFFFFSSRRRHTRYIGDWSSDVCSSDLVLRPLPYKDSARIVAFHTKTAMFPNFMLALTWPAFQEVRRQATLLEETRSEERRVGKECRSRWWRY